MPRQATYGFGGLSTDGGLLPTYGFMGDSNPPGAGTTIYMTGKPLRKSTLQGTTLFWRGAWILGFFFFSAQ